MARDVAENVMESFAEIVGCVAHVISQCHAQIIEPSKPGKTPQPNSSWMPHPRLALIVGFARATSTDTVVITSALVVDAQIAMNIGATFVVIPVTHQIRRADGMALLSAMMMMISRHMWSKSHTHMTIVVVVLFAMYAD